ncbi:MAG TPA: hypothetical protein VJN42_08580 [Candidatus Acidoferrum sp.]|nr:hypothetical protein [Candidatus Acidoferrum sp.]
MLEYRDKGSYLLHELVVMPNLSHLRITPGSSTSLEKAMQLIKGGRVVVGPEGPTPDTLAKAAASAARAPIHGASSKQELKPPAPKERSE